MMEVKEGKVDIKNKNIRERHYIDGHVFTYSDRHSRFLPFSFSLWS